MTPGEDEKSGIVLAHAARIPVVGWVIALFLNIGFLVFVHHVLVRLNEFGTTNLLW